MKKFLIALVIIIIVLGVAGYFLGFFDGLLGKKDAKSLVVDSSKTEAVHKKNTPLEDAIIDGNKGAIQLHVQEEMDAIQQDVQAGKPQVAAERLSRMQKILKENKSQLNEIYKDDPSALQVINTAASIPSIDDLKDQAYEAAKEAVKNQVKESAKEQVDKAKQSANDKINEAREKLGL